MKNRKETKKNNKITKRWKLVLDKLSQNKEKIYMRIIEILGIILAIISILITLLVRQDTAELTKLSEKPVYYKIKIYPNAQINAYETDKYVNLNLNLRLR